MTAPLHHRLRDAAAALPQERVALSHLADVHGAAAQGTLLVLLAAPCVLPVPGVGTVLGGGLVLMALAMWRGQACSGLPRRVAEFELSAHWARRVLQLLARFYDGAGRLSRRRLSTLASAGAQPWLAVGVALMAVVIILPIPFGNVLPALALMLLGLGMVFSDGLAVLLAAAIGAGALLYTATLGLAAWAWAMAPLLRQLQA